MGPSGRTRSVPDGTVVAEVQFRNSPAYCAYGRDLGLHFRARPCQSGGSVAGCDPSIARGMMASSLRVEPKPLGGLVIVVANNDRM